MTDLPITRQRYEDRTWRPKPTRRLRSWEKLFERLTGRTLMEEWHTVYLPLLPASAPIKRMERTGRRYWDRDVGRR